MGTSRLAFKSLVSCWDPLWHTGRPRRFLTATIARRRRTKVGFVRRFTTFPGDIEKAWKAALTAATEGRFDQALAVFTQFGHETFSMAWPFRCSFTVYKCGSCGDHMMDCLSEQKTGVLWRRMRDLNRRRLLTAAGGWLS